MVKLLKNAINLEGNPPEPREKCAVFRTKTAMYVA